MTATQLLLAALAGAAGAALRHELTVRQHAARATAAINVAGAAALGVATATLDGTALLVLGGGLLGATTTFSTWMLQVHGADGPLARVRLVLVPLVLGVAAAALGRAAATTLLVAGATGAAS